MIRIALIGFGEVGQILADDLKDRAMLTVWDTQFADPAAIPRKAATVRAIALPASAADAVAGADLIVSAVTAAQTLAAAEAVAAGIAPGARYLDLNSASPGQKVAAAQAIAARGGVYVEGAVMSPFPPKRLGSPILLGGPAAQAALPALAALGFSGLEFFAETLGQASAAKMCRSVMIKGIEALLTESLLAARHYGVEPTVLASLEDLLPGPDWPKLARYMISRSLVHGRRRAEEMQEVARTVTEAGGPAWMSAASALRHAWAPQFSNADKAETLLDMLDAIRADAAFGLKDAAE
jgi:3-hydroxyisobutyrate dehydrogenase-like beta-hydroxyacid dehydrogenase